MIDPEETEIQNIKKLIWNTIEKIVEKEKEIQNETRISQKKEEVKIRRRRRRKKRSIRK